MTKKSQPNYQYHVDLYDAWVKAGQPTRYAVRRDTGITWNTIIKYLVPGGVLMHDLPNAVLVLLAYFTDRTEFKIGDYVHVAYADEEGKVSINKNERLSVGLAG